MIFSELFLSPMEISHSLEIGHGVSSMMKMKLQVRQNSEKDVTNDTWEFWKKSWDLNHRGKYQNREERKNVVADMKLKNPVVTMKMFGNKRY